MTLQISTLWLFLISLLIPTISASSLLPQATCEIPNWTVQDIRVTYSDDTFTPGLASFNITNSITHNVESLKCELSFNTRCEIPGTPLDDKLHITFLVNMGAAVIRFNQTWGCVTDPAMPSFVLASAELDVNCPETVTETMTCTALLDSSLVVNGSVVTPVPEVPVVEGEV